MSERFIRYIKCVGTGPKHNRDLSAEEMKDAMAMMLDGKASPEQTAAFLLGWRLKPESAEEFRAALQVLDTHTRQTPVQGGLELGYPFDGKTDNPYLFPLVAPLLRPFGITPVVYTGELQPSKNGVTVRDICDALPGIENLKVLDRRDYCPELAALSPIRQKLGLRTGLNTLERLPKAVICETAMIGVFHKPYVKKYVDIFADRYRRLVIVKGNEGTPEIFGKCRLWICEEGNVQEQIVDPADYGVTYPKNFKKIEHEQLITQTLNPTEALQKLARFNAAVWLYAAGKARSVGEGMKLVNSEKRKVKSFG